MNQPTPPNPTDQLLQALSELYGRAASNPLVRQEVEFRIFHQQPHRFLWTRIAVFAGTMRTEAVALLLSLRGELGEYRCVICRRIEMETINVQGNITREYLNAGLKFIDVETLQPPVWREEKAAQASATGCHEPAAASSEVTR